VTCRRCGQYVLLAVDGDEPSDDRRQTAELLATIYQRGCRINTVPLGTARRMRPCACGAHDAALTRIRRPDYRYTRKDSRQCSR